MRTTTINGPGPEWCFNHSSRCEDKWLPWIENLNYQPKAKRA
jgi:hypothetical protein